MNPFLSQVQAFIKCTGGTFAITAQRGCTASKTGTGDYNVTLDRGADETQCCVAPIVRSADVAAYVVHTSDTVKQILLRSISGTPAAADGNFEVMVHRLI